MNVATCPEPVRVSRWLRPPRRPSVPPGRRRNWLYATAALLLGGYLLFAHGCHGDEDNELLAAVTGKDFAEVVPWLVKDVPLPRNTMPVAVNLK